MPSLILDLFESVEIIRHLSVFCLTPSTNAPIAKHVASLLYKVDLHLLTLQEKEAYGCLTFYRKFEKLLVSFRATEHGRSLYVSAFS